MPQFRVKRVLIAIGFVGLSASSQAGDVPPLAGEVTRENCTPQPGCRAPFVAGEPGPALPHVGMKHMKKRSKKS